MSADAAQILRVGAMEVHGRIAGSSNATLLVTCRLGADEVMGVYKPRRGERPLWDFPPGLDRREVAAYELSEVLGWHIVPVTVERVTGPFGPGSVQLLVDDDGTSHYFTLRDDPYWEPLLETIAAFDVVANNADRKSGHVLSDGQRLWAIDHGLCFHPEPKLRTVIWDFASCAVSPAHQADLGRLAARPSPPAGLAGLLDPEEWDALRRRARGLARDGTLPVPDARADRPPIPWPLV